MKGGYRPGAGRKRGSKDKKPRKGSRRAEAQAEPTEQEKIRAMLSFGTRAKAKIYQDYLQRIGQGGTLSVAEKRHMDKLGAELEAEIKGDKPQPDVGKLDLEAYDYLRQVWNDPGMDPSLRIRAAEIVFKGAEEKKGKKDEKNEAARRAGQGKFQAGRPPLAVVK
jgi:hypothetical protein